MQETFNTIVRHLRAQGRKAINPEYGPAGMCSYRYEGLKCAAGVLIPDELYDPAMEGKAIRGVDSQWHLQIAHIDLVEYMQHIHDTFDVAEWEIMFKKAAEEFDLVVPD